MKTLVKLMLGAALVAAPTVAEACTLVAGGNTTLDSLLTFTGQPAPAPATEAASLAAKTLMNIERYKNAVPGCTEADVARELGRINGWGSDKLVSVSDQFLVPKAPAATSVPASQSEPVAVATTVPQTAITPPVAAPPSPELKAVRAELQTAKRERAELAPRVQAIAALPTAALTSGERDMLTRVATLDQKIARWEKLERRMASAEAVNAAQSRHLAAHDRSIKAQRARIAAAEEKAEAARVAANAALAKETSWIKWVAGLAVLLLLASIVGFVFYRKLDARIKLKANDESLDMLSEKVEKFHTELSGQIEELGDALPADIRLDIGWEDTLAAATPDEKIGLQVIENTVGKNYEPTFTIFLTKGEGDTVYCTAGIQGHNPNNAISVANLERTVRKAGFNNRLNNPIGRGPRAVAAAG